MKKTFRTFLTLCLFVMGTAMSWADFTDFKVILSNAEGTLLTEKEITDKSKVEFGYVVDSEGTVSRVDKDDATSMGTIKGTYHSEHGLTNFEMTVNVDGGVKIGMGTCAWGGDVKVNGATSFNTNNGKCWHNDKANNIAYGHYTGEAGTITIAGGGYTPYVSVEAESVKSNAVAFSKGTVECEGTLLPAGKEVIAGETFAIPVNRTLYKAGYTLTGWTDGANTYNVGTLFTPTDDVTLTPVFTQNTKNLADRTEAVTVKWDFQTKNGAPTLAYQNQDGLIYVAQATVEGQVIDVKLDFSTNPGKVANGNWTDWCQMNAGTKFTIPSCKGATVSIESYSATTTTTIDGQTDYTTSGNTVTAEIANKAEAIDIVIGDGSYFRYIQTVLPVVQAAGGKTYTNEPVQVVFAMNDASDISKHTATPEDGFQTITFDNGTATIVGVATIGDMTPAKVTTGLKIQPAAGASDLISWTVKPAVGLTFTPTHITGYINRYGTDSEDGVKISAKLGDGSSVALGTFTAVREGKDNTQKFAAKAIYKYDITLTDEQKTALSGADGFILSSTVGVANNKQGGFGEVVIEGTVSGTIADVNKYTVSVVAAPEEAGSVSIYPKSDDYVEGDEVQLTATENFGYDFVNWTNAAGEEVSTEAKFKATITADETFTANFKQVETYELKVNIDGDANDYMISYNPAPVVVDNKNMYEAGTKVTITASENPIITFNSWSTGETAKEIVVDMASAQELTAEYSSIDYIVGWDFMQPGNNGRAADFAAADNDAVSLVLRNAEGATFGWLDKSQIGAGGYEGRPGGVNWKNDVAIGTTYWQTEVNAEAFTNLKIQTAMVYNYNAYQKYDVQASLDGEEWETIGSINMPGTKNWTDLEASFPEKYNNQKKVYVRWIADKTSNIDGTSSANDGACLGASYITGTKKLINDGVAPVLVKTVPAEGADNASANGKIVLTFDEKVKVAEGAKATLGTMSLVPAVSGKTVSFEYKGLEYSTSYTFTLPANTVADLTDNYMTEAVTVNFQTKVKPAVTKGLYDAVVSNGEELAAAIKAANTRADQNTRYRIFVKKGAHVLPTNGGTTTGGDGKTYDDPRTTMTASNVSIIGEDFETTSFTNITPDATWNNGYGQACPLEGIGAGDVLINKGTSNYFQGITIRTSMGDAHGRDIALNDQGNKTIFKDARLWGYQDTYVSNSNKSRFYFEGGVIRGRTDYICGKGDVWFEKVTFQQVKSGYLAVPSVPTKYGYILNECTVVSDGTGSNDANGAYTLGRPWGSGTPTALFINCVFNAVPTAEGWSEMSGGWPARYAEYNSTTAAGTVIDLSNRKKTFGEHPDCNNPVLSAAEASEYSISKVMGDGDDWDPTALTEQASAPTNVTISGTTLSWDNSNYVFCWAVIKNGEIVDFTTEPTYTVDDAEATWSVRAANEMGGLGEATVATEAAEGVDYALTATITPNPGQTVPAPLQKYLVEGYVTTGKLIEKGEAKVIVADEAFLDGFSIINGKIAYDPTKTLVIEGRTFTLCSADGTQTTGEITVTELPDGTLTTDPFGIIYNGNFVGIVNALNATGVKTVKAAKGIANGKFLINNKVIIIKDNKQYDAVAIEQ